MSTENLFEQAIIFNESDAFFKGEGRYFVRDPNWGEHVYAAHYGGWVDRYINSSLQNLEEFDRSFSKFVAALKLTEQDFDHFFGNLTAIAYWKSEGFLKKISVFDVGTSTNKEIENFLTKLKGSRIYTEKKDLLIAYVSAINDRGFKLPVELSV